MSKVLGIDLGTTNSCVSIMEAGNIKIIPNGEGNKTTPSVVTYTKEGERLVGELAKRQAAINPKETVSSIKRDMGTNKKVTLNGKTYSPQEISAMILQKLKIDAEQYLGEQIKDAVITVPAYFNDAQRQATKDAGRIAGLNVKRIINEPTAAAIAYGLDKQNEQKILVYDLGGGTFDVSIIEISDGVIEVLSTSGDNQLGGDDFNKRVVDYIVKECSKLHKVDLSKDMMALQRVKDEAEKAKIALSSSVSYTVHLPFITTTKNGPINLELEINRTLFESLIKDLVDKTANAYQNAMSDAGLTKEEIHQVFLVGGSTRVPLVYEKVKQLSGKIPNQSLNPDECVAIGAGIQGGKLSGDVTIFGNRDILLLDVTPLSLSIETVGGVATRLIDRNTTIPSKVSQVFTTSMNFQTQVEINVLQGERPLAKDNKSLGKFKLKGIKRALRGIPQIEVTFNIDADGIVNVSAKDLATGNHQEITITDQSNLSQQEIERAMNEAKQYEEEDKLQKERITFKNDVESLIYQAEALLADKTKELDKPVFNDINQQIKELKKITKKDKIEKFSDEEYYAYKEKYNNLKYTIEQYQ